ncbi:DNA polymerase III subunit gamma/tau [Acetobacter sp. AN02]|uniref:DNA polymerase III subunit gamma/tau n=1 Tax=Acetobacter sp. AN02 TaxID=2894186 RepID=UPI002434576C|nr:DNA polymerase III subunit gamma/tau [Acetobacter sp. AN02]MDG6094868.1 DNA polymerase III subunit gamma/tau [Acetobacter sp. AN02]
MSDEEQHAVEEDDLPLPESDGAGLFGDAPVKPEQNAEHPEKQGPYRVLARKYRPATFNDLIGQDTLVRTLRNAFAMGRVAHAFMLTGVRGVGKTTTARIIARALNCIGPDGKGGPVADPCGVCPNCTAILADRHPDVLEMDAASRTGVDDVREIIEATRFRPMQGRMKVFIIDEVHMLSRNAFNALLKTLEEPPAQVTFIFATTELRKVPVTVLSRCQRFDLRRVSQSELTEFFGKIAEKENCLFEPEALSLIARAADGSVRDGLSLLDQAIAQGALEGEGPVPSSLISAMLGLADRQVVFDLFRAIAAGDAAAALQIMDEAHMRGADPAVMLGDLLDLTHMVTRLRTVPDLRNSRELPEAERVRGAEFAEHLSIPVLSRIWQMLLKGINEVSTAPDRREAADMVLIRLCFASDLPDPTELLRRLESRPENPGSAKPRTAGTNSGGAPAALQGAPPPGNVVRMAASGGSSVSGAAVAELHEEVAHYRPMPRSWREMVALIKDVREPMLHGQLLHAVHLVNWAPPVIRFRPEPDVPRDLAGRLHSVLLRETGQEWDIAVSADTGEPTLAEQGAEVIQLRHRSAEAHPLVRAIMSAFPDAEIGKVTDHSLDDYGLPPEILLVEDSPDLEFAPDDAVFTDMDERPDYPGTEQD